jgi:hypothetical protein
MLPRLDAGIPPVKPADGAGAGVAIGDGRQAAFQRALQNLVGQTVSAEVMSKMKDGSYLVKVADNAVRMMLPGDTQVGSNVPLTVLSAQPRPTFQLGNAPPGSATVLYSDGGEAAAELPSQGAAVYVPGGGKPASGAAGQPGLPGAPGGGAQAAADGEAVPGQLKPGAGDPAAGRPGAADAAQPGRPGAATPNPAAALATGAGQAAAAEGARPQSLAATLLGKAPLIPSHELPELGANTPQATLSSAARVLTTMLSTALSQPGQASQLALIGKTALFGNAAPDTADLTQKLQETISKSGLFYESHVAEWAKGERPLADLMREPQMQRLLQQGQEGAARAAASGPDLTAAQMVNQQLHTQEQNRVLWNGQAWPGQQMQWEVRRDQREGGKGGGDSNAEPEQIWRSGVRFRLPMLGAVSAAVTLIGDQVHIQVQTDSDGSASTLRAWSGQLESAMQAAGAQLSSLTISRDDEAQP